jgi:hypothetical protein
MCVSCRARYVWTVKEDSAGEVFLAAEPFEGEVPELRGML